MELQREILRIRPSIQERVEDVRSPIQQQAPTAREERVWLKVVGDSPALDIESSVGRAVGIDTIALEDNRLMARPGNGQRSRESRDAATGDNELHTPKLSGRKRSVSRWGGTPTHASRRKPSKCERKDEPECRFARGAALSGGDTPSAAAGSPVVKDVVARITGKAFKTLRLPPPDPERAAGRRDRGAVGQG